MANEPKISNLWIQATPAPLLQNIWIQTRPTTPVLKAIRLQMTQPAPTSYPKLKAFKLTTLGPTFWLNGQVMPGIKPPTGKV